MRMSVGLLNGFLPVDDLDRAFTITSPILVLFCEV